MNSLPTVKCQRIVPSASPRAAIGDEVSATSFPWPRHMRAGGPALSFTAYLPTERVQSRVLIIAELARGAGEAEISNQISALARI